MDRSFQQYQSYTLRLSKSASTHTWQVTLFCAQDGKRYHFSELADLYAFLDQSTADVTLESDVPQTPPES